MGLWLGVREGGLLKLARGGVYAVTLDSDMAIKQPLGYGERLD